MFKTKFKFAAALIAALAPAIALAQGTVPGQYMVPLGYCRLTATTLESATPLSSCSGGIPAGASMAAIQAETAAVRYRDDGTAPTASVGMEIVSGANPMLYTGTLSELQFIAASGSPLLDVVFYRQ
jgi:hypothetical protein